MAKKATKILLNSLFGLFICLAITYAVGMRLWPEETSALVGYRFYTVVTGSMEPTIPTTSVVLTRCLKEDETPQPGQIVTFHADRLGTPIVLTHYLREVKEDDTGRLRFYTQAENVGRYDDYATYREDLIGTYVLHIPYLGKVGAFLISSNALSMFVIIGLILALYKLALKNIELTERLQGAGLMPPRPFAPAPWWKRIRARGYHPAKRKRTRKGGAPALPQTGGVGLHSAAMERCGPGLMRFSGEVENTGELALQGLALEVCFFDAHSRRVGTARVPLEDAPLPPAQRRVFEAELKADPLSVGYAVKVCGQPQPAETAPQAPAPAL